MSVYQFLSNTAVLITAICCVLTMNACKHYSENDIEVYKALDESISYSIKQHKESNDAFQLAMQNRLMEIRYKSRVEIWLPKAHKIREISSEMIEYLERLKEILKKESGVNKKNHHYQMDTEPVYRLFISKGKGDELFDKLQQFRVAIISVDPAIWKEFNKNIVIITRCLDSVEVSQKNFTNTYFSDLPVVAAMVMLNKFQENVLRIEKDILLYCYRNTDVNYCGISNRKTIVGGLSSSYVKAGDSMDAYIGIGVFSTSLSDDIIINGKKVSIDYDGIAHYKFKTPNKTGKHFITVESRFIDEDGIENVVSRKLYYTVSK